MKLHAAQNERARHLHKAKVFFQLALAAERVRVDDDGQTHWQSVSERLQWSAFHSAADWAIKSYYAQAAH